MKSLSLQDIEAAFDPVDRPHVVLPELKDVCFTDIDYLGWRHPDGHFAYLCVRLPERVVGLVFRLDRDLHTRGGYCDLCLSGNRECGTTLAMTDSWGNPRASYGVHICSDFNCSAAVRDIGRADHMRETITMGQRIERFQMQVERFVRRVTGAAPLR